MYKNKPHFSVFLLSMFISLVILGSVFLIFLLYTKTYGVDKSQSDIPYTSDSPPPADESMTLLLLGCQEAKSPPELAMLFFYDAPNSTIFVLNIPCVTLCQNDGKSATIAQQYEYAGIRGSVSSVKSLLGVDVERYIRIQASGMSNIVDFFGGLPYNVSDNIIIDTQTIQKGEQLLDGRRFTSLMFYKKNQITPDCNMQSELTLKLLKQGFTGSLSDRYNDFVSTIFYNTETNINQYDFAKRQTNLVNSLKFDKFKVKELSLSGSYNQNFTEFTPYPDSVDMITKLLNGQGYVE